MSEQCKCTRCGGACGRDATQDDLGVPTCELCRVVDGDRCGWQITHPAPATLTAEDHLRALVEAVYLLLSPVCDPGRGEREMVRARALAAAKAAEEHLR